jgi:Zn-dependent protease with chaperone function
MFAARGIAVSLSVFVIFYCALSVVLSYAWRKFAALSQGHPIRHTADFLFFLRMSPFAIATLITAAFAVPSFLLFEPRSIDEPIGAVPLVLALCGVALGLLGLTNAVLALRKAAHTISTWTAGSHSIESSAPVPVLRISRSVPAMTAAGILRPRVLLSSVAEFILTRNELETALGHEIAHIRRRDNLKKLLLLFVKFPGMRDLEGAWLAATEMAADDAAVSNPGEALDLAAALIKLSRLGPLESPAELTTGLITPASTVNARVERLIAWKDNRGAALRRSSLLYGLSAAIAAFGAFAVSYSYLLVRIHTATEWLVR